MAFPIVYDVLMRVEVEARNPVEASKTIADQIAKFGIEKAVVTAFETIRDDNNFPPKDNHSRHTNGFAVFTSTQKLDLVAKVASALHAARRGDEGPGEELLRQLSIEFAYLENSELRGIRL